MAEALHDFMGFVGMIAVFAAIFLGYVFIEYLGNKSRFAVLLNGAAVLAGAYIIFSWPGSSIAWLIGAIFFLAGGFNIYGFLP